MKRPPREARELLMLLAAYPGKFAYPTPKTQEGLVFLKQILLELTTQPSAFSTPVTSQNFKLVTQPLWKYLDKLHTRLWKNGKTFPNSLKQTYALLNKGEIFLSYSLNHSSTLNLIEKKKLPPTMLPYIHEKGAFAKAHFLAIPAAAPHKAAALVFINFLLSPEAQAKKEKQYNKKGFSVLDFDKLTMKEKQFFTPDKHEKKLQSFSLWEPLYYNSPPLQQFHPSWSIALRQEWKKRYQ